jgi:hypothetical protein
MTFNDIQGDQLQARLPRIARGRAVVVRSRVPRLSRDWRRLSLVAR